MPSKRKEFFMTTIRFGINRVWYAIAMLVMGILLILGGVNGANTIMGTIITVLGVIAIVFGIFSILAHSIALGVIEIVVGALLISFAWTIAWIAFLVFGAILLAYGIIGLAHKRNIVSNIIALLVGILIILIGCGCNFAWQFANIFFYVAGVLMIVDAVLALIKL